MDSLARLRSYVDNLYAQHEPRRHACEVDSILRQAAGDGRKVKEILAGIEGKRGKAAADRLRADLRAAWKP